MEVVLGVVSTLGEFSERVCRCEIVSHGVDNEIDAGLLVGCNGHADFARIVKQGCDHPCTVDPMQPAIPYLTFPGTCAEAMRFYSEVLGGEITILVTLAESPLDVPAEAGELLFNSEVRVGDLVIKASDNPDGGEVGTSMSLFVEFPDSLSRARVFTRLAEGGHVIFPLDGPFGMVRDRFGVQWMLTLTA